MSYNTVQELFEKNLKDKGVKIEDCWIRNSEGKRLFKEWYI